MDTPIVPLKRCSKCKHEFPATTEFYFRDKSKRDGLCSTCKACRRIYIQEYNQAHEDELRAKWRQFRLNNPEIIKQRRRRYRLTHHEELRERDRKYAADNAEKARLRTQKWVRENPERARENHKAKEHNRRAKKRGVEGRHTAADAEAQFQRQKGLCYYCGCKMTKTHNLPNSATTDHVVPLDRGGRNSPDNLVIACRDCNSKKSNKLPHEWQGSGRLM